MPGNNSVNHSYNNAINDMNNGYEFNIYNQQMNNDIQDYRTIDENNGHDKSTK